MIFLKPHRHIGHIVKYFSQQISHSLDQNLENHKKQIGQNDKIDVSYCAYVVNFKSCRSLDLLPAVAVIVPDPFFG